MQKRGRAETFDLVLYNISSMIATDANCSYNQFRQILAKPDMSGWEILLVCFYLAKFLFYVAVFLNVFGRALRVSKVVVDLGNCVLSLLLVVFRLQVSY